MSSTQCAHFVSLTSEADSESQKPHDSNSKRQTPDSEWGSVGWGGPCGVDWRCRSRHELNRVWMRGGNEGAGGRECGCASEPAAGRQRSAGGCRGYMCERAGIHTSILHSTWIEWREYVHMCRPTKHDPLPFRLRVAFRIRRRRLRARGNRNIVRLRCGKTRSERQIHGEWREETDVHTSATAIWRTSSSGASSLRIGESAESDADPDSPNHSLALAVDACLPLAPSGRRRKEEREPDGEEYWLWLSAYRLMRAAVIVSTGGRRLVRGAGVGLQSILAVRRPLGLMLTDNARWERIGRGEEAHGVVRDPLPAVSIDASLYCRVEGGQTHGAIVVRIRVRGTQAGTAGGEEAEHAGRGGHMQQRTEISGETIQFHLRASGIERRIRILNTPKWQGTYAYTEPPTGKCVGGSLRLPQVGYSSDLDLGLGRTVQLGGRDALSMNRARSELGGESADDKPGRLCL
ncbi:hypothetical protein FB451DRAFT_1190189 [Mycena latifolia]|nr:hypothetical protein FB451DRAFT_1190189 [Mycena latifolia]